MDHGEYFRRATAIHNREKVAIQAIVGWSLQKITCAKTGEKVSPLTVVIASHQAIVAEMVALGQEFNKDD